MNSRDINYGECVTALIHRKGRKERIVPLIAPLVAEIGYSRGWTITTRFGKPWQPKSLSVSSTRHLKELGIPTTLHSMRHAFATDVYRTTRDILLVQSLLGHEHLSTTQIYAKADVDGAHERMAPMNGIADSLLGRRHLSLVTGNV